MWCKLMIDSDEIAATVHEVLTRAGACRVEECPLARDVIQRERDERRESSSEATRT